MPANAKMSKHIASTATAHAVMSTSIEIGKKVMSIATAQLFAYHGLSVAHQLSAACLLACEAVHTPFNNIKRR